MKQVQKDSRKEQSTHVSAGGKEIWDEGTRGDGINRDYGEFSWCYKHNYNTYMWTKLSHCGKKGKESSK